MQAAWCELLARYPLQWFCTLTFRSHVHGERAFKSFRRWVGELNVSLYGRRWCERDQGVYWVLAWEWQKRGVIHFHALVGDVADLNERARRLTWMDRWNELAGIARIEAIESHEAVERYCSKYITKGGQIDLSSTLKSFAQQRALSVLRR
ncbi:MAG: rolling circle replication-associated protein [Woeseiaceae bacterium]